MPNRSRQSRQPCPACLAEQSAGNRETVYFMALHQSQKKEQATMIYGGTKGSVFCVDERSGREVWRTAVNPGLLGSSGDVAVLLRGNVVVASCYGNIWGLDAASGRELWHNDLPGLGHGFVTLCDDSHAVQYIHVETQSASHN
jgi:hypothetical protein